ncbi:MAG TPA: di-trans,poly-cis-decaprenylcistransferase [Gemmatimonadales bacterium]|nr:di-trans,poly-cis-decaprenylcistransferase [Gemmatimonadales bacterium]
MQQSTSPAGPVPLHVGIIMDGNGRWATRQGHSRAAGHRAGAAMVRRLVEAAPDAGIGVLTLFAFSADNWRRPKTEVGWLMRLFREYLRVERARCVASGVRLEVIGRRDRIGRALRAAVEEAERETAQGTRLHLRIALDYSARDAILRAAQCLQPGTVPSRDTFGRLLAIVDHGVPVPEVDLLIRTGGERRLSDFLLWEAAYAELHFSPLMWPEFGPAALQDAVRDFATRERRFGGLPDAAAG